MYVSEITEQETDFQPAEAELTCVSSINHSVLCIETTSCAKTCTRV